jgi:hypothetical protein
MHREFALVLERALRNTTAPEILEELGLTGAEPFALLRVLQVDDCPRHVEAQVTSSIAFPLSKVLAARGSIRGPAAVAEDLKQAIISSEPDSFELSLGGGGHLNATAHPRHQVRWLAAAVRRGAAGFFFCDSFFEPSPPLSPFPAATIDWTACIERVRERADAEVSAFLDENPVLTDIDCKLMLLGLAADPEIDPRPFRSGLYGSQNIPWYLRRFDFDARRWEDQLAAQGSAPSDAPLPPAVPAYLEKLAAHLMRLRKCIAFSSPVQRPERLFRELLELIGDFSTLFHQPRYRTFASPAFSAEDRLFFVAVIRLCRELVALCLASFGFKELLRSE